MAQKNSNVKAALRLPLPDGVDFNNPGALQGYLETLVRAISQSFVNTTQTANTPFVIGAATTASRSTTSISATTSSFNDLRNNYLTLLNVLKSSGRVN